MYSQVIKLSTENKINVKNSWSLPLIENIDHFLHQENEEETNFQRASCTLDASVKIYSYRVDDTWTTSYRVLENLSRSHKEEEEDNEHAEDADSDNEDGKKPKRGAIRGKRAAGGSTIETNPKAITVDHFDLEFEVDPLFHRMSQTFDEGGAKGMLLVNLPVRPGCDLAFDSHNGPSEADDARVQPAPPAQTISLVGITLPADRQERLPLASSLAGVYADLSRAGARLQLGREMETQAGSKSEKSKKATAAAEREFADAAAAWESADNGASASAGGGWDWMFDECDDLWGDVGGSGGVMGGGGGGGEGGVESPTTAPQDGPGEMEDDMPPAWLDGDSVDGDAAEPGGIPPHATPGGGGADDGFYGWDDGDDDFGADDAAGSTAAQAAQLAQFFEAAVAAPAVAGDTVARVIAPADAFSVLDTEKLSSMRMWAGPKHWKLPMGAKAVSSRTSSGGKDGKKARTAAPTFLIDFSAPAPEEDDARFAGPTGRASTQMSKAAITRACQLPPDAFSLPEDAGVSAEDLARLFLRPDDAAHAVLQDGSHPSAYAGAMGVDAGVDDDDYEGGMDYGGDDGDWGPQPPMLPSLPLPSAAAGGLLAAAPRVQRVDVGYARKAKRVDVRRLKRDVWQHITANARRRAEDSEEEEEEGEVEGGATASKSEALTFRQTVDSLAPAMPGAVTVPFYFITVLHLANEQNLALEATGKDLRDFTIRFDQAEWGE